MAAAEEAAATAEWEGDNGVDWESGETPRAARDAPPRTVLFATPPVACVSTMMLPRDHTARKYYPKNTRYLDPTRDSGAWNPSRELVGALNDAGLTDAELVEHFPVSRAKRRGVAGYTPVDYAVLDNELSMIDPWTGNQYGIAMVEKYTGIPHACRPNCTLTFGIEGWAYLVTGGEPIAAGTPLTISKISHQHGAALCVCMRMGMIGRMTVGGGEYGGCVCSACVETAPAAPMDATASAAASAAAPTKGPGAYKRRGRGKGRGAKSKSKSKSKSKAATATKPTPRECDPTTCSMVIARAYNVMSPVHAQTVYEPTDFLSYLTQSKRAMAALVAAWTADGAWIARAPYALSRFALKLSLLGGEDSDGCNMAEVRTMYAELAAAIVADTAANGGVPRVLTPAGVIALAAPPPVMEVHADGYADAVRRVAAGVNDVLATHPWMGVDEVHDFSPWMCARSPTAAHHIAMLHRAGIACKTVDVDDLKLPPPEVAAFAATAAARIATDTAVAPPVADTSVCAVCRKEARSTCSRCGVWRYCSPACQREHWASHKVTECRPELSDKVPAKLDMQTALSAWMSWPLRETALRNYPKSGADVISSLIDRAGARAAANAGTKEDPGDVAARRDSAANGAAMLRFMNANCEAGGCGTPDRSNLRACTKCALVFYCSDAHAKTHWAEHRVTCGLPDASATDSAGNARHFFGTPSAHA